jgi:serine/threonine protein kinase
MAAEALTSSATPASGTVAADTDWERFMTKRLVRLSGNGMAEHPFLVSTRYHGIRYLGEGSFGVVARARDYLRGDEEIAIKRVHQAFNSANDARHLLREVRLLRALAHPNLLPLLDIDMPHSYKAWTDVYLVSPLKPYTLSRRLDQYAAQHPGVPLPDDVARNVLTGTLRALKYMHSANVVHRDLKPDNILLDGDWTPFICDMGLARSIDPEHDGNLSVDVATKPYRAPGMCGGTTLSWRFEYNWLSPTKSPFFIPASFFEADLVSSGLSVCLSFSLSLLPTTFVLDFSPIFHCSLSQSSS